jgi:GT2 family glycosyltransferase
MADENYDLSIVILNYNVCELLINCLDSIFKNKGKEDKWQVIVVDNASLDDSVQVVKKQFPQVELIANSENLGFSAGNNVGVKKCKAPVILFLNPDTLVVDNAISKSYEYLMGNPDIGALTCRVELPDGKLDYSSHRGFPTPWNSFCYFLGLSKIFPKSSLFSGYTSSYLDIAKTHEIDCLTGAFMMVRKIAGQQVGFWDTSYFWNGEDIEFCYSLKEKGWKIYFYPDVKIIHYKGSSSGLWSTSKIKVEKSKRLEAARHGISAMRIFYLKHFYKNYPPLFRDFVLFGIKALEHYRKLKIWIS